MNTIALDFSTSALIDAIEANYFDAWSDFGRFGGEVLANEEILRVVSLLPYIPYNGVLRVIWQNNDIDAKIRVNLAYFKARNAPMLWTVSPSTKPPDLAQHLVSQGFRLVQELVGMAVDLDQLSEDIVLPHSTVVQEVKDLHSLRQFVDLVAWKWHLPPAGNELMFSFQQQLGVGVDKSRRRWLAYQNNEPVAKAFLTMGAGVAGIYGVSTIPAVRRQGIGRAITLTALLAARQLGYRIGVLHSTQIGEGVYRSLGFQEYCRLYIYGLE
jgi:GNAT superfamily N-acetyltransferase